MLKITKYSMYTSQLFKYVALSNTMKWYSGEYVYNCDTYTLIYIYTIFSEDNKTNLIKKNFNLDWICSYKMYAPSKI